MKKISLIVSIVLFAVLVFGSSLFGIKSYAATKNTSPTAEEENELGALIAYRDSLIKSGASESDIAYANAAIAGQQQLIAQKQAEAAEQLAMENARKVQEAAELAKQKAQEEAIKQYEEALKKAGIKSATGVIFVGDSRFVQMHETLGETGAKYIAQNAQGYKWFSETAIPKIDACVGKGIKIVINLGVNDPGNADKYVALVNAKAAEWIKKGAKVYYATVNPVWENPYTTEEQVKMINSKLISGLKGVKIIDTHNFLMNNGYKLKDGLHYDGPTYLTIYNYIMGNL